MTPAEYLRMLSENYRKSEIALKQAKGMDVLTANDELYRTSFFIRNFTSVLASKPENGAQLFETAKVRLKGSALDSAYAAIIDAKREYLARLFPEQSPEREKLFTLSRTGSVKVKEASIGTLDGVAKEMLTPEQMAEYRNLSFFGTLSTVFLAKDGAAFSDLLAEEGLLSPEAQEEIMAEMERVVPVHEKPERDRTEPLGEKYISELMNRTDATEADKEALAFITENVRLATKEYSGYLNERNGKMMDLVKMRNKEIIGICETQFPDMANAFEAGGLGFVVPEEKRQDFFDQQAREFRFTDEAREAMRKIMHIMDDMGTLNNGDVCVGEEGTKIYGLAGISRITADLHRAMREGRVHDLPELTAKYREIKAKTDEMLDLAKDAFPGDPLNYVDNLDVARNGMMPNEYRFRNRDVTCLACLYNSLKVCKILNVPIDDFVKEPNRYLVTAQKQVLDRFDADRVSEGRTMGEKLFLLDSPPPRQETDADFGIVTLTARAAEGFRTMGGNEECCLYNAANRGVVSDYYFNNATAQIADSPLSVGLGETVQNMILFDGQRYNLRTLSANPSYKFDPATAQTMPTLDTSLRIKSSPLDYGRLTETSDRLYRDYMKQCLLSGRFGNPKIIRAIRSLPDRILKELPEQEKRPAFVQCRDSLEKMTAHPSVREMTELVGGRENFTPQLKGLSLQTLHHEKARYDRLPRLVRAVSYLPFVRNSATRLRRQINSDKAFLRENNVTNEEIRTALETEPNVEKIQGDLALRGIDYRNLDVRSEKEKNVADHFQEHLEVDMEIQKERDDPAKEAAIDNAPEMQDVLRNDPPSATEERQAENAM